MTSEKITWRHIYIDYRPSRDKTPFAQVKTPEPDLLILPNKKPSGSSFETLGWRLPFLVVLDERQPQGIWPTTTQPLPIPKVSQPKQRSCHTGLLPKEQWSCCMVSFALTTMLPSCVGWLGLKIPAVFQVGGIASEGSSSESRCGVVELWSNFIRRLLKQVVSFGNKLPPRMMCGVWA